MKKTAIIVDSSCGLTKEKAKKLGWYFIPLHIDIDGKTFSDGIDIDSNSLFNFFGKNSKEVKTSSSKLGEVIKLLDKINDQYDNILIYPISHHLSSQYQSLKILEGDYPKLKIVKSINISQLIVFDLLEFEEKLKQGKDFKELVEELESEKSQSISLMPKYNEFLVKGGRLSPAAAAIAKLLKIVPIIKFENGRLIKEGKGRIFSKTVNKVIRRKKDELDNEKLKSSEVILLHSRNSEINDYKKEVQKVFGVEPILMSIPSVVAIHTGQEAVVVIVFKCPIGIYDKVKQLDL